MNASRVDGARVLPGPNGTETYGARGNTAAEHAAAVVLTEVRGDPERSSGDASLRFRLILLDTVATVIGWLFLGFVLVPGTSAKDRGVIGVAAVLVTLGCLHVLGLYRSRVCAHRVDELGRIIVAAFVGGAAFAAAQWHFGTNGAQAIPCGFATVALLVALRWHYRSWLHDRRAMGMYLRKVVLVGANDDASVLLGMLAAEPELGYEVTSVVVQPSDDGVRPGLPCAIGIGSIPYLARATGSNGVVIVASALTGSDLHDAMEASVAAGLHVQVWPGLRGVGSRRLRHVPLSGEPFFYVEPLLIHRWQTTVKRLIDIVGSAVALVAAAPIIAAGALLVKREDHGPAFHRQERIGMNGIPFTVYKIRTMTPDNHEADLSALNERTGPLFKSSRDPRVTRIGNYLRVSSIDELPQLWNVLTGSMSLVGPRPALPSETAQFDDELLRRLTVRPGLTGLWQIEARDNPSFGAYRRLDLHYVENWSLRLDLTILFSTPSVILLHAQRALRQRRDRTDAGAGSEIGLPRAVAHVEDDPAEVL
jgi:exopolysaccharide biosynthesis polyprenyl glycosylphosphotransferase